MTRHEYTDYSDEEQKEFLARCRLLKREWRVGDWIWYSRYSKDREGVLGSKTWAISIITDPNPAGWCCEVQTGEGRIRTNPSPLGLHTESKDKIWLPTLDDLIRMEGWSVHYHIWQHGKVFWVVQEWSDLAVPVRGPLESVGISEASGPCLAALRAIQGDLE
jgi:hypothetical protein